MGLCRGRSPFAGRLRVPLRYELVKVLYFALFKTHPTHSRPTPTHDVCGAHIMWGLTYEVRMR